MTSKRRAMPAFLATDSNLGGVHSILAEYQSMTRRVNDAVPSVAKLMHLTDKTTLTMAQRLSYNRARRQSAVDLTHINHINHVYHMHRRIEESYSATERKKNVHDVSVHPVRQKRATAFAKALLKQELEAWQAKHAPGVAASIPFDGPGPATTHTPDFSVSLRASAAAARPHSAPSRNALSRSRGVAASPLDPGDGYLGLSLRHSLRDAFPSAEYQSARREADARIYRDAIMGEIVEHRLYKERDLQRLFRQYASLAPLSDKDLVEGVVRQLKEELDVR